MDVDASRMAVETEYQVEEREIKVEEPTYLSDGEHSEKMTSGKSEAEQGSTEGLVNGCSFGGEKMDNFLFFKDVASREESMDVEKTSKSREDSGVQLDNCSSTPKINEKKPRVRSLSESSSTTPSASKIAKMSPRATRSSQNPDFAAKQRKFLNRVHDPIRRDNSDSDNSQGSATPVSSKIGKDKKLSPIERKNGSDVKKRQEKEVATPKRPSADNEDEEEGSLKKRRTKEPTKVVGGVDSYCWRCHRDGNVIPCEICPRVYHLKCVQMEAAPPKGWMCPECSTVMQAENTDTRSRAMRMLTLDQLCTLLRYALNRMKSHDGADDFAKAVDLDAFPQYKDYIVKPMDLTQLERNIKAKMYGSTEAFMADAKWIVHNSIIFNSVQSKFTNAARALLKICRQEMQEIENCPDCYLNAHTRNSDSWFIEACRRPHLLVWAKLKGFPFWPAKAMTTNSEGLVDVRFFGAHDRAWVPVGSIFLFTKTSPVPASNKNRRNLEECLYELECHVKKLKDKFGQFEYPPYKTPYDPNNEDAQLALFIPKYESKGSNKRTQRVTLQQSHTDRKPSPASKMMSVNTPLTKQKLTPNSAKLGLVKIFSPKMVSFPHKNGTCNLDSPVVSEETQQTHRAQDPEEKPNSPAVRTPPPKHSATLGIKKSYKTPLTAAAKKCFATEEKTCFLCKANSSVEWSIDGGGKTLCSSCALLPNKPHKDKTCAQCNTQTSVKWQPSANEEWLCADCISSTSTPKKDTSPVQIQLKKDEQSKIPASTVVGTVMVERKASSPPAENERLPGNLEAENNDEKPEESSPDESMTGEGDRSSSEEGALQQVPTSSEDMPAEDFAPADSPPKFIIPKACVEDPPDTSKKISIVDRLQEKLCFAIEEAIKDRSVPTESESEVVEKISEEESETVVEKVSDENTLAKEPAPDIQVLLHDLKNDKELCEKMRESKTKPNSNENSKPPSETRSLSETSSDVEESSVETDNATDEESNKKKKESHIDNVVRTITERKNSVDEKRTQSKSPTIKDSSSVVLDDSNDEIPVLIIDEGESNSPDNKSPSEKSDKSRRKGIPAKVFSRSSTSTESSSPEEQSNKSKSAREVLDEVSGQFRRSSGDSNVTITLVTDDAMPIKKTKEIRSVNISKSLSLSVINEPSASLDMECVGIDLEEQVIVDPIVKKLKPRPTARKTLPKSQSIELPSTATATTSKGSDAEIVAMVSAPSSVELSSPPTLITIKQPTKMYGPSKVQTCGPPGLKPICVSANVERTRVEVGPVNALLEDAVEKISGKIRGVMEEMLLGLSEGGCTEATVKSLQLEMERVQWRHRQEMAELKHNTDLVLKEYRATLEADKQRVLLDAKHKFEVEKERIFQETKRKTWCTFCGKEANLYCCWNTAYCTYNCQQAHWNIHMSMCSNKQQGQGEANVLAHPPTSPPCPPPPYNLPPGPPLQVGSFSNS